VVNGPFLCATLTGRRGSHTPYVQARAETSDTGAEVVKPDPALPGRVILEGAGVGDENEETCGVVHPSPHSIGDLPTASHVCCSCQIFVVKCF